MKYAVRMNFATQVIPLTQPIWSKNIFHGVVARASQFMVAAARARAFMHGRLMFQLMI